MTANRLAREYGAQVFAFGVALADRILLTGLMVRLWGADTFGSWAVAMAAGSLVTLFDFGLSSYFSNRVLAAVQTGDKMQARHMVFAGNLLLGGALVLGLVAVGIGWSLFDQPANGVENATTLVWLVLAIAAASAARQATAIQVALYRAHNEFARSTFIIGCTDLARVVVMIAALLAGADAFDAAMVYLVAMLVFSVAVILIDLARRYPDYPIRIERLATSETKDALSLSGQYGFQFSASNLLTYVPTLLLGASGAGGIAVAQFALMRTLANFARQILVLFANVFGLEVSRRLAIGDSDGVRMMYREATQFVAVQTACATGALAALGSGLFLLWTGDSDLFDPILLWLALGPPVLVPSMAMALQVMATANWPKPLVAGRIAQLALTVSLFLVLPVDAIALRMMAALAIGEVLGLGVILTWATARKIPGAGLGLELDALLRSAAALGLTFGAGQIGLMLGGFTGIAAGLFLCVIAAAIATLVLGISGSRRVQLIGAVRQRFQNRAHPQ